MAAQLPVVFRSGGGDNRFSFDFFDAAAGAGYKRFYPAAAINSAATTYFLTTEAVGGDFDQRSTGIVNSNFELNFDITFNNPVVIAAADAIINWTFSTSGNADVYAIFTVYHVDAAAAETSLGTITSNTRTNVGASEIRRLSKVVLTSKSVAIGEKLRLEIRFFTSGAGTTSTLWYDPSGRQTKTESGSGATISTNMTIDIPFKVDI